MTLEEGDSGEKGFWREGILDGSDIGGRGCWREGSWMEVILEGGDPEGK